MLVKVKALTNGFHQQFQKEGSEFFYDAKEGENKNPVLGKWMKLIEVVKQKKTKQPKKAKKEAE